MYSYTSFLLGCFFCCKIHCKGVFPGGGIGFFYGKLCVFKYYGYSVCNKAFGFARGNSMINRGNWFTVVGSYIICSSIYCVVIVSLLLY